MVSSQLVSPLFLLNSAIQDKSPTGERLSRLTCLECSREIKVIYDGFNQMIDSINKYVETNRKIVQAEQTTRTLYYQSQINPHFLYNTMDTLRWISLSAGDTIVADEISRLSSIYRYYINPGDALIRVKEEVQLIHNYMDLQKLRFKDKFHFQVNMQEMAENVKIPKLLIQPLVKSMTFNDKRYSCFRIQIAQIAS